MSNQATTARFFKHSSVYAIGNILNRVGAFLLLPLYTGYLGVGEYGAFELFYSIYAVISGVLGVGIAHATLRFYFDYKDDSDRSLVVSTNFLLASAISVLGVLVVVPFTGVLMGYFFPGSGYEIGFYFLLASVVFELSSQVLLSYLRALEKSWLFVSITLAKLVVQIAINTYLIVFLDRGVEGALIGNCTAVFLGWVLLALYTLPKTGIRFSFSVCGKVLRYSYPFLLSTLLSLVSTNIDKFLINGLLGLEALGVYALAMKLAQLVEALVGEPFSRAYGSYRFSIMNEPNAGELQANIVKMVLIACAVVGLGVSYFSYEVVSLFSQPEFLDVVKFIPILVLAQIAKIFKYASQTGILVQKKTKYIFYINGLGAAVGVLANTGLIYLLAIWGVCFAQLITQLSMLATTEKISGKYFPVTYAWFEIGMIFIIFLIFSGLGMWAHGLPFLQAVAIKMVLLCAAFGLLYRFVLVATERAIATGIFISGLQRLGFSK